MCSPTAAITDYFKPGPLRPPVPRNVAAPTTATPKRPVGRPRKCPRLDPQDHTDAAKDNDEKHPRLDQQEAIQDQNDAEQESSSGDENLQSSSQGTTGIAPESLAQPYR